MLLFVGEPELSSSHVLAPEAVCVFGGETDMVSTATQSTGSHAEHHGAGAKTHKMHNTKMNDLFSQRMSNHSIASCTKQ